MPYQNSDVGALKGAEATLFYISTLSEATSWNELRATVEGLPRTQLTQTLLRLLSQRERN